MLILLSVDITESCLCKRGYFGRFKGLFGFNDEVRVEFRSGLAERFRVKVGGWGMHWSMKVLIK